MFFIFAGKGVNSGASACSCRRLIHTVKTKNNREKDGETRMKNLTYKAPKENYLTPPGNESCYEYMINSYHRVSKDLGEDYTAFVTPVASFESATKISKLFSDIEKTAAFLASKGVGKGDVFTVFLPSCGHAFTAFYALSKLGAIGNFVHPMTPPAQLMEIMKHTKSKGLFVLDLFAGAFASVIDEYMAIVCSISDYCNPEDIAFKYAKGNEMQNAHVPESRNVVPFASIRTMDLPAVETVKNPGKDDAIYLHGGGTTGRSKTIIHSAFSFNSLAYAMYVLDLPHDYETAHSLCVLPCFHAFGLGVTMHYALCNAYRPIMISKFDAVQANNLIAKYNIVEMIGVPKMFQKMMDADNFENDGVKNLKILSVGGDFVSRDFVENFNAKIKALGSTAQLARGYGLTEMCAVCTTNNLPEGEWRTDTVGKPILGVDLRIWDDDGNELPAGEVGEVVATGDTMMNRYLPDDVIQETGIYIDEKGEKWIRTGDIGYLDADGHLIFTSRKKRVIIISGYNIYPATIEEKLTALDYINEVCAVQGYDENGKPEIKLCVSLKDPQADEEKAREDILAFCRANIEAYSCPRRVEFYELLPRTKMEKIDFIKLSDPIPETA